jgi:hypothetical protein
VGGSLNLILAIQSVKKTGTETRNHEKDLRVLLSCFRGSELGCFLAATLQL